jgi:hypothetical protein
LLVVLQSLAGDSAWLTVGQQLIHSLGQFSGEIDLVNDLQRAICRSG